MDENNNDLKKINDYFRNSKKEFTSTNLENDIDLIKKRIKAF